MKERREISLLSFVFFFSGTAALMYQVAWQRLLTVYYGVGSISIALIVSVYMLGLGSGALLGGYISESLKKLDQKIIFYFFVEVLIGIFGLASPLFLDFLGRHTAGSSYNLSFFYMVSFLSIPTILMGITLPLLTKIFNRLINDFLRSVSYLYFINTLGAVIGALASAYVIISFWGLDTAVYLAAIINFILGILIFSVKSLMKQETNIDAVQPTIPRQDSILGIPAYSLVIITGFLAVGYEMIWFRVMGVLLKSSPYVFPSVLSVYLSGIAIGSYAMNGFLKRKPNSDKRSLFFTLQFLIGIFVLGSFIGYYYLTRDTFLGSLSRISFLVNFHPHVKVPDTSSIATLMHDIYILLDVFLWPLIFVLIPTILMGASFPLIALLALSKQDKEGKTVGTVYFFTIVGNVLGAALTGFILLPTFGTELITLLFALTGVLFGVFIIRTGGKTISLPVRCGTVAILVAAGILLFPGRGELYEIMHSTPELNGYERYFDEGQEGIVMTYENDEDLLVYVNGHMEGKLPLPIGYFWNLEAMSHAKKNERVLIIGYAGGTVVEGVLKTEGVKEVVIVELNGTLIRNLKRFDAFNKTLSDPRVKLVVDDGRRYLLRSKVKFDIVIMEALRQPNAYSNNLFSIEFFKLIEDHLNKEGIFLLREYTGAVMLKTLLTVFDHVKRYNEFSLVSNRSLQKDVGYWDTLLEQIPSPQLQTRMLQLLDLRKPEVINVSMLQEETLSHYRINTDWKPVSEYYIGEKVRGMLFIPPHARDRFQTPYGY